MPCALLQLVVGGSALWLLLRRADRFNRIDGALLLALPVAALVLHVYLGTPLSGLLIVLLWVIFTVYSLCPGGFPARLSHRRAGGGRRLTPCCCGSKAVTKSFGGFVAVRDVSLSVERGRTACVIGPNGAGKSTLFNLITGHLQPTRGQVFFGDRDITGRPPHAICRMGIGRSFQRTNIFPRLSVFDNVQIAVLSHQRRTLNMLTPARALVRDETVALLEAVGLAGEERSTSGTLSYGLQKQLELGIALASEPQVLLLDEPTAGMSPQETADTIALIGRIVRERGLTLLFTEHDMDVVFSIAERITVLHQGAVLAEGTPEEVQRNEDVQRIYLGEAE